MRNKTETGDFSTHANNCKTQDLLLKVKVDQIPTGGGAVCFIAFQARVVCTELADELKVVCRQLADVCSRIWNLAGIIWQLTGAVWHTTATY